MTRGLSYIPESAFKGCGFLKEVRTNGIDLIDNGAFMGCTSLECIKAPDTLKYIENSAFYGCESLETMIVLCLDGTAIGEKGHIELPPS